MRLGDWSVSRRLLARYLHLLARRAADYNPAGRTKRDLQDEENRHRGAVINTVVALDGPFDLAKFESLARELLFFCVGDDALLDAAKQDINSFESARMPARWPLL